MTTVYNERFSSSERTTAWVLLLIGVVLAVVGWLLGWSRSIVWFDEFLHLYNAFAVTLVLAVSLYGNALMGARGHPLPMVITVMLVGLGLGGLWEILEWVYDQLFTQGDTIKGKTDTIIDLIMDTIGALAAGILALRMARE